MRRYNLVNLPEDCSLVTDAFGDWMTVAEHEVLTVKYRDALERILSLGTEEYHGGKLYDQYAQIAKEALEI